MDFTANWGWPQWTWLILMLLSLIMSAGEHSKPRENHNAFLAFIRFGLMLFILIAGGFFA